MKIIQLAHRTVGELLEEIFAITSKKKIDTSDKRVLYAVACAMKNRYENDVPKWIPVSERLPEEPGYYITSNEYNGVGEDFYYDGHFWNADKNAYSVVAWMPKPKAYKSNK